MNSRNMPEEEELDNMFRQAADSFEPEFDPEAWRQMEQKLDKANRPPAATGNWARRSLLALLLLISGWGAYYFTQRKTIPSSVPNQTIQSNTPSVAGTPEQITPEKASSGNQEPLIAEELASKEPTTNLPVTKEQTDQPTRLLQRPNASTLSASRRKVASVRLGKQTSPNRLVPSQILNTNLAGVSKNLKNDAAPGKDSTLAVAENSVLTTSEPTLTPSVENSPVDSTTKQAELKESILENNAVSLDSTKTKPNVSADSALQKIPATFLSKVTMSLVFGPDFSTVKFVRPEKASTNVGVLLSYSFGRRWAISTGLVRAKKVYGAKPEDYHMKPGYWQSGHLPDEINAVCKVLDIPLNIRYAVVALPRQSIYVQTGLSSYIMLHEDYRYDYSNYGKPYSKHWVVPEQNRHFFQVLNLSVGYSKQIKPGISVGAEPFAKIPLAGIGAGKVNLTSFGAFFSVGYRFR